MTEIKNTSMKKENTLKLEEIRGRKVIDDRGKEIAKVKEIHIDPKTLRVEGMTIDGGLFRENDYIGRGYICSISDEAVVLCETPLTEYIGMKVLDSEGKDMGKVKEVYRSRKTNAAYSLIVDQGIGKDDLTVPGSMIDKVAENIMLDKAVT